MPENEILDRLLSAFWLGELVASIGSGPPNDPRAEPVKLLQLVAGSHDHPGLLFMPAGEEPPPVITDLPDGGALADPRRRVVWPPGPDSDLNIAADDAFQLLAQVSLTDYTPDIRPVLGLLQVMRTDFDAFCQGQAYPPPQFWFGKSRKLTARAAAARCSRWLRKLGSRGPKPCPKPELRARAMALFPGLSDRAFDRIWPEAVPKEWQQAGAPSKPRP